jgi:photosystem II stability/assembly factor-like uncharacterized protein
MSGCFPSLPLFGRQRKGIPDEGRREPLVDFPGHVSLHYGVKLHSSGRGWIVGEQGALFLTDNGGTSWQKVPTGIQSTLQAVAFADANWGCAVGLDGVILQSADGGKTWRSYQSPVQTALYNVAISGTSGWAVGDAGVILNSTDAGRTWKVVTGPDELLRYKFLGLFLGPDTRGVITGTQGIVLFTQGTQVDFAPVVEEVRRRK